MATTVADVMVATLKASGVQRVYGIPGDSLNGFTDALRRDGTIDWAHVRHEEAAAFAAAAGRARAHPWRVPWPFVPAPRPGAPTGVRRGPNGDDGHG